MMLRAAVTTAGWPSSSRSGSVAASAGTMTWSRSSGSVAAGSAACAAAATATACSVARQGGPGAAGSVPVHSSSATSSKLRWAASRTASRPR